MNLAFKIESFFEEDLSNVEFQVIDTSMGGVLMTQDEYSLFKNNEVKFSSAETSVF